VERAAMSTPRISVNKLGEYLTTPSAIRRRAIVRDQKTPHGAVVPRYRHAAQPIEDFLNSGGLDVAPVIDAIGSMRTGAQTAGTEWVRDDLLNTADALEHFLEVADELPMEGVTYIPSGQGVPKLAIAGVDISVQPNLLLHYSKRGRDCIGALKIHYIRDDGKALREAGQEYVSALCHQWLLAGNAGSRQPDHAGCMSIDLFRNRIVRAPASFTRRMNEVEAACSDIALLWPSLP
jgi:hypothetical protein